jgi:hypothetical protein
MEEAHIYGDVGYWQSKDAQDWGEVTLSSVRDQYESQKNAESITLHIHSPGGYFKRRNYSIACSRSQTASSCIVSSPFIL